MNAQSSLTRSTTAGGSQPATASAQPIYSMTGFASAQSATADGTAFTLSLKSVNHRFLDVNLRLPGDSDALEAALRRLLKERLKRGHVDVTLFVDRRSREASALPQLNVELLKAQFAFFGQAAAILGVSQAPDLHELLRVPGVVAVEARSAESDSVRSAAIEAAVLEIAPGLLEQLNQVRATEGAALAAELKESMMRLRTLAEEAATLRSGAREAHLARLRTRLAELLGGDASMEAGLDHRLLAEAAMIAERSDVEEELVRLRAHIESFVEMLAAGGELGKRLDFLLQELNREANTMLSKTTAGDPALGLRLTSLGLEMKSEIERAREQVQNIE